MKISFIRAIIEISSILFLFYSNLLMGEFEHSGMGEKMGLAWALRDIFTSENFIIALLAGLSGYLIFECLRSKYLSE